jgi:glycosyltransferase involved in cell wall biosynthesis
LVQDGYNGFIVPVDNPGALALAMERVASKSTVELNEMRRASRQMSAQLTTDRWARYVLEMLTEQAGAADLRRY